MAGRRTNLALLLLIVVAFASGVLMWAVGSGWGRWPTIVHGTAGVAILVMAPWKSAVSRRGIRRRGAAAALPALGLASMVVIALASGFVHRTGVRDAGPVLVLQVHVGAALVALPWRCGTWSPVPFGPGRET